MKLVALLQAKNEERYLPGWLENVAPVVDGIVAVDDGSTDNTAALLSAHPKTLEVISRPPGEIWDERGNHMSLIRAGRAHDADWFLCIDADERIETRFSELALPALEEAERQGKQAFSMQIKELWGDRNHFRTDGIWGGKARYRLFKNVPDHKMFDPRPLHRYWMPLEIVSKIAMLGVHLDCNVYHLRMIRAADRAARHARYLELDPDSRFQKQGYDYLVDERGIELRPIPEGRDFVPLDDPAAEGD